jgi:hypothetical protein
LRAYWSTNFLATFLLLLVIIHLIRRAMLAHRYRDHVYWGLLLGVAAVGVVSLLFVSDHSRGFRLGSWLTELGRNYYFSAALLNAILWFTLLRFQHQDRQVYLFSSGLGLHLTGTAIAHALRLTTSHVFIANQILILTYLASLYVLYVAVKRFTATACPTDGPTETSPFPLSLKD